MEHNKVDREKHRQVLSVLSSVLPLITDYIREKGIDSEYSKSIISSLAHSFNTVIINKEDKD